MCNSMHTHNRESRRDILASRDKKTKKIPKEEEHLHNALLLCVDICAYNSNFRCKSRQARDSRFFFIIFFSKEKLSQLSARKFSRWLRDFEAFQQQKKILLHFFYAAAASEDLLRKTLSHMEKWWSMACNKNRAEWIDFIISFVVCVFKEEASTTKSMRRQLFVRIWPQFIFTLPLRLSTIYSNY